MKINLNSDINFNLLNLNEFYKLVSIGYDLDSVVQYLGKGKNRGNDKSISLKLIMINESQFSNKKDYHVGDIIDWYYTGTDGGYLEKL